MEPLPFRALHFYMFYSRKAKERTYLCRHLSVITIVEFVFLSSSSIASGRHRDCGHDASSLTVLSGSGAFWTTVAGHCGAFDG